MNPTLVFLHGGPGFRDYLKPYFAELQSRFTCIFYDQLRGPTVTVAEQVHQLDLIVNAQKLDAVLIGHSWGGVLATEYILKHPTQIRGLVLISTGLSAYQWKDEFYKEMTALELEDASLQDILLTRDEISAGKSLLDLTEESFCSETFDSINETYLRKYDLTTEFSKIAVPILNVFGNRDVRFPVRVTKSFRNLNPQVEDLEISGAGHFPFLIKANQDLIIERVVSKFDLRG